MYVIIGATGFLGTYLIHNILQTTNEKILAVARKEKEHLQTEFCPCDISDEREVIKLNNQYLSKSSGNKIIYLAAYHHPDMVEKNPKLAWDINVTSLSRFLNIAENVECFFYSSTDSVYGEGNEEYRFKEDDELHPVNKYGLHKCVAERLVTGYGYNVVRFPFLISSSLTPEKKHFYDEIAETISQNKHIEMFCDSYRSALDFNTASKMLIRLIEKYTPEMPQIINICGDEALSKYDVGLRIADRLKVNSDLIRPVSIHDNKTADIFGTKRAASTLMDNTRLKEILGLQEVKIDL